MFRTRTVELLDDVDVWRDVDRLARALLVHGKLSDEQVNEVLA